MAKYRQPLSSEAGSGLYLKISGLVVLLPDIVPLTFKAGLARSPGKFHFLALSQRFHHPTDQRVQIWVLGEVTKDVKSS